jgi:hypothetical protein
MENGRTCGNGMKIENHEAAMEAGITGHVWSLEEIVALILQKS